MIEVNKIYNEDCLETMAMMGDKSVDLILTDLPYGINLEYDTYKDTKENWYKLFLSVLPEMKRVAKMVIMPICQIAEMKFIYDNHPPNWIICWYKGSPGHRAYVGFNDWEPHLVYGKTDKLQMHDYFYAMPNEREYYDHPCPKPLRWATWLISRASKDDDLVYDPFLGSGTTGVACAKLDRRFIGSEISEKYCHIAEKRIKQELSQLKLAI